MALALAATPVLADEAKVAVSAEVVLASLTGNTIDPPTLKAMQEAMSKKVKYGSLKRLSQVKLELEATKPQTVRLPNGKDALLSLEALKNDVATVRVKLPPADATYNLGKKGTFYVQAGPHEGGDLWLLLSPSK